MRKRNTGASIMFGGETPFAVKIPDGLILVPYGGGVNTLAELVMLRRLGIVPRAIVMANPGSERKASLRYLGLVARPWLRAIGFPSVVVISRKSEARRRLRAKRFETLAEECARTKTLPSIAYGKKRCSLKFKRDPQLWWAERQQWAQAEWDAGRKIVKAIGYDADESHRVRLGFDDADEHSKYAPWYPLHEAGIGRAECADSIRVDEDLVRIARAAGLDPVPPKSACTFCASNTIDEWEQLQQDEPEAFAGAVEMSRVAFAGIDSPDVVGLMRCNTPGKRHLHLWRGDGARGRQPDEMPCECAL